MNLAISVIVLVIGIILSYVLSHTIDNYHSLSVEKLATFFFLIISYFVIATGLVYTAINIDKAILNSNSKGKIFILYNVLKFILGVILIILGFISLYAGFASNSIIWGVIFTFFFLRLGVHMVLSVIKQIKL